MTTVPHAQTLGFPLQGAANWHLRKRDALSAPLATNAWGAGLFLAPSPTAEEGLKRQITAHSDMGRHGARPVTVPQPTAAAQPSTWAASRVGLRAVPTPVVAPTHHGVRPAGGSTASGTPHAAAQGGAPAASLGTIGT